MSISRRTLLRDTGFLSLAAMTLGCRKHLVAVPAAAKSTGPFENGVRVIFSGSWLFCPDAAVGMMQAISVDMAGNNHTFVYGNWNSGIDKKHPGLVPNPGGNNPHQVTLAGYTPALRTVDELFMATVNTYSFNYLHNPNVSQAPLYRVDDTPLSIRIISLPIPTRILPAAYVGGASVKDLSGGNLDLTTASTPIAGVATAHIFDYAGASGLTFKTSDGVQDSSPLNGHYHFHTVPNARDHTPSKMFHNLQSLLLNNYLVELDNADTDKPTFLDPPLPDGLSAQELEEVNGLAKLTSASCAGGGIGLGGDCC